MRKATQTMCWLVAFAMALTGCEGAHTHQIAKQKPQPDPEWWGDTAADGERHFREAVFRACPVQGFLSNEKCVKAKIVETFAKQNDAGKHCLHENDPGWLFICVVNFTTATRIYQTMGIDPQDAIDWDDSFEAVNTLHRSMAARLTAKCPDTAQADCVASELATMLGVPTVEAHHCVLTTDAIDLARCGSGLIRIEMYRTAERDVA